VVEPVAGDTTVRPDPVTLTGADARLLLPPPSTNATRTEHTSFALHGTTSGDVVGTGASSAVAQLVTWVQSAGAIHARTT
jgi:hypothetical protein